jgi:hypothetical protein
VWHWLVDAWHATWGAIMAVVNWVKNKIIDPIVSFFQKYLVAPIVFYLSIILDIWKFVWGFLSVVFADWMAYMRFLWGLINTWLIQPAKRWLFEFYGWIDKVFAQPAVKIFHWLMDQIHAAWNRLLDVISTVKGWLIDFYSWLDRTIIQPILSLFDKISGAIGRVLGGIKNFADSASHMGGSFAHFLGFDQGGPVPGPPGAPMLAVVHGGEYVLSRDMISGMRSARLPTAGAAGVPVGQGTPQRMDVHNHIYLDGKEMHAAMIRPAQRYKRRNGTTGLGT